VSAKNITTVIEPIQELYPGDDLFASPEAYGLAPTDYSEEIPPIHI